MSHYYIGMFGDDTKSWAADHDLYKVALITHIPTRSEFLIYTHELHRLDFEQATNRLLQMVEFSLPNLPKSISSGRHEIIFHKVADSHHEEAKQFDYLKLQLDTPRLFSTRYSTNETVATTLYATEFPSSSKFDIRLFVVAAMLPRECSPQETNHLLDVLANFLQRLVVLK